MISLHKPVADISYMNDDILVLTNVIILDIIIPSLFSFETYPQTMHAWTPVIIFIITMS